MDRIKLLCDIGELNHLFRESVSVENFLQRIVVMVTQHMKSEVCSIYLYDEETDLLTMKATEGLSSDSVEQIRLKLGDGLTGKALKELRPICVSRASKDPGYKLFIGSGEEQFENFLAVPIVRGIERIGVLVLQRKTRRRFNEGDVLACKAVASQLANIIENARFLMTLNTSPVKKRKEVKTTVPKDLEFVRGKAASEGYAFSTAYVLDKEKTFASLMNRDFNSIYSIADFDAAITATEEQLQTLQKQVEEKLSDAASLIFASHLLILKDKQFVGQMRSLIESGHNPPDAILKITSQFINIFAVSSHHYVREKVQDVEDLVVRLMGNLIGDGDGLAGYGMQVVVARDIFPSDLLRMSSEGVKGIVLVSGGVTSHLSILARSLEIPMVIANRLELMDIPYKTPILIDANAGNVYVEPSKDVVKNFEERWQAQQAVADQVEAADVETVTKDGQPIQLLANINLLNDLIAAKKFHCQGVGLYRTEFPFIIRSDFPSEEEQYVTYRKLIEDMAGKPVTFRTLDIGGDKILSYYHDAKEQNPAMGMRSIRFTLQNKRVFSQQIRAMLRAGVDADLRIMFPMVSSLDEFIEARDVVRQCCDTLTGENVEHNDKPLIGMMVEMPSVVEIIDDLAKEADFFSIGSNDFVQFTLGVDRTNENVEKFYIPHHPAVLRSIAKITKSALAHKMPIAVCGDMAHEPQYIPFILGLGITTLSIDPTFVPKVQQCIAQIDIEKAKELAANVIEKATIRETAKLLGIAADII